MSTAPVPAGLDYHRWRTRSVEVGGVALVLATKPGLIGQGRDEAAELLADEAPIPVGGVVVSLHCGSGLLGALAAVRGAAQVFLSDRNSVAVSAARRTLDANGVSDATVVAGHGSGALPAGITADLVTIRIPTEKPAVVQLLADAFALLRVGGRCCIAGATNEGIKSAATLLETLFGNATVMATRSGCRVVIATKRAAHPADATLTASHPYLAHDAFRAVDVVLRGEPTRLFSRPGVFSWEHLDEATALLADHMQIPAGADVLDLGCGSGPLGITAARLSGAGRVHLVDVDAEAVRCAERAVAHAGLTNCDVQVSDIAAAVHDQRVDVVVTNPPFHVGKGTDLEVPMQFIIEAHALLKPGGTLQLVANRTLPYERMIQERFGKVATLHDGPRFKILAARR